MNKTLNALLNDDIKINHLLDTEYLKKYMRDNLDPIPLALGETWSRVPLELVNNLSQSEPYESGYQMSMYGLPSFRRALKNYIFQTEKVSTSFSSELEVGVTWNGTRSSMVDYCRYMLDKNKKGNKSPVFITTDPAWDYKGVFMPLGIYPREVLLTPQNNFTPCAEDFRKILEEVEQSKDTYVSFIVVNAQHNPTGINWSKKLVEDIIKLASQYGCGLLVDNAYYGCTSDDKPSKTSVLSLLEENWERIKRTGIEKLIFGVRSLGKQFNCNGWGIGAIWGTPQLLDQIVNKYRVVHTYNYNAILQKAMEKWIESTSSQNYLSILYKEKEQKDQFLENFFSKELKYPREAIYVGIYAPYVIFEIPQKYQLQTEGVKNYIKDLFFSTGVLLTDCWAIPRNERKNGHLKFVRMYTGVEQERLKEALRRMLTNGFSY